MVVPNGKSKKLLWSMVISFCFFIFLSSQALAFTLRVVDGNGVPILVGYKWVLELDNTNVSRPGVPVSDSISVSIHKSHAPVIMSGYDTVTPTTINPPALPLPSGTGNSANQRFFVSVLPDSGYAMGGAVRAVGQGTVTVTVQQYPIPTAQISINVFVDQGPINNAFDEGEQGLGGCTVKIEDGTVGGPLSQDAFGNLFGTEYDAFGNVTVRGTGTIKTLTKEDFNAALGLDVNGNPLPGGAQPSRNPYNLQVGEALVKYLTPGKFGVVIVPPELDDLGRPFKWVQTTTIEGTPVIDAWVKANEPPIFIEGFGTGFKHATFGFVVDPSHIYDSQTYKGQTFEKTPWNKSTPEDFPTTGPFGTITGTLRANHFARPPRTQGFFAGEYVPECWVGLNDPNIAREIPAPGGTGEIFTKNGRFIAQCGGTTGSDFAIPNVPPGTYDLVWWDTPLDYLFGFQSVTVPPEGGVVNLGEILAFRWFGTLQGSVFVDADEDGFRDPDETGVSNVPLNIRFRDGRIYQPTVTDLSGEYEFGEVFPFFKWLVAEVGFTNHKATGMTAVADAGGGITIGGNNIVPPHNGWDMPSFDKLNPQPQIFPPSWPANGAPSTTPVINPNTGNNLSRTETGPVLLQAMQLFLNQTNVIDWGKKAYAPGENGGISGVVFYAITRAEDDPKEAVGDPWEPGIPRVQVNLYLDEDYDGIPDDLDGDGLVTLADADNYPLGWATTKTSASRSTWSDVNRNGNNTFSPGDAVNIVWTDSWDDNAPRGCIQPLPIVHGVPAGECADAFSTWNQVRPGVFDGGYAFTTLFVDIDGFIVPWDSPDAAGEVPLPAWNYIVEVIVPPGHKLVKEEDKNVDFGDEYKVSLLAIPYPCVNWDENGGLGHLVPDFLSLFYPAQTIPAPFAGEYRPLCDRKMVTVYEGQNAPADFHLFTDVPKAARAFGFTNNDLSAEFNVFSPNFGEKLAPAWIPVSFVDWTGKEIVRVYTDEFGHYNALLPSTFTVNAASPSGVSPNMMTLILNPPTFPDGTPDPFHNPTYSVTPWTFQYWPASTSYLDTPLIPQAAFAPAGTALDTNPPTLTPVIRRVDGPGVGAFPLLCTNAPGNRRITITSMGNVQVPNPDYDPTLPPGAANPFLVTRNYGFGTRGTGTNRGNVYLNGNPLTINSWSNTAIIATVPASATTGRLMVKRSNGNWTEIGVTLHIVNCTTTQVIMVNANQSIQTAIDSAGAGALILVANGTYNENVVMNKPVRLQGAGAGGTLINADPNPLERLQAWHDKINSLNGAAYETFLLKKVFYQNEAPGIAVIGQINFPGGNVQFPDETITRTLNPGTQTLFNVPGQAMIDGFTISGSKAGGGIAVFSAARYLVVSNNHITGNTGNDAGGISWGVSNIGFDQQNINGTIFGNKFDKNGGAQGAGAAGIYEYSNNYVIEENLITGNFSRFNGGAISHWGLSPGMGTIRNNKILFNECHFGAILNQAGDGGAIYIAGEVLGVDGSGSVTIEGNLIQGNLAGSGYGAGIRAFAVNGLDVSANPTDPTQWHELNILNNIIVNNVSGLAGGGIALQDVVRATISGNTIAHNDSTATSALAFTAGQANSNPQPAGIVSGIHSAILQGFLLATGVPAPYSTQTFSDPILENNIIFKNRSFFNQVTGGVGSLAPNPVNLYWDLSVLGSVTAADPHLNPQSCTLTSTTDLQTGYDYNSPTPTNTVGADIATGYFNTLTSAAVVDEGGNSINVLISPLVPTGTYPGTYPFPLP